MNFNVHPGLFYYFQLIILATTLFYPGKLYVYHCFMYYKGKLCVRLFALYFKDQLSFMKCRHFMYNIEKSLFDCAAKIFIVGRKFDILGYRCGYQEKGVMKSKIPPI